MLLFIVEDRFMITGRGLLLTPGIRNKKAKMGDKITIVRPDKSRVDTFISGVSFSENFDILVGGGLTKEDVPVGSEVWLIEK